MSATENLTAARTLVEMYNRHTVPNWLDEADAFVADDIRSTDVPSGDTRRGRQEYKRYYQSWADAFSDARVEIVSAAATDETSVVEFIGRGTHDGPLAGPAGVILATGRKVELHLCAVDHFVNGKVVETSLYYDALGLLMQLGVIPAPTTAKTTS